MKLVTDVSKLLLSRLGSCVTQGYSLSGGKSNRRIRQCFVSIQGMQLHITSSRSVPWALATVQPAFFPSIVLCFFVTNFSVFKYMKNY